MMNDRIEGRGTREGALSLVSKKSLQSKQKSVPLVPGSVIPREFFNFYETYTLRYTLLLEGSPALKQGHLVRVLIAILELKGRT